MSEQVVALDVAADHPAYAGHFPGRPILPGVVLLDLALHALAQQRGTEATAVQLKSAKFLSPVKPGEALSLHFTASPTGGFRFDIRSGARSVASGVVAFATAVST